MGEIHVHEFVSLDGVIDNPYWSAEYPGDDAMSERIAAVCNSSQGILLGRRTFEMFAQAWPQRTTEDDAGAPFFNEMPKYVVSSTLADAGELWANSTSIGQYDVGAIRRTAEEAGNLYVSGSGTLVRQMLADGLVDELHLCVYPTARGAGPKLFPDGVAPLDLERTAADTYDNGVLYLALRPKR